MPSRKDKIIVIGAGLVGSLLALLLRQQNFHVEVYEKRSDPRKARNSKGRSINLALSHRGIRSLKLAGIYGQIEPLAIPMKGRMMHNVDGSLSFQPYGKEGQYIYSVSRTVLNQTLIQAGENEGVAFFFNQKCEYVNWKQNQLTFEGGTVVSGELIIGSDGAFSTIRRQLQMTDRFNYSQHFIEHGYKELTMESTNGDFGLEPNYLHIWPREHFMLIALPNLDKTFTCTLFFPFEGSPSFGSLTTDEKITHFFECTFPDVMPLIPNLRTQYKQNPVSSLVTVSCTPWHKNRILLIGDSAHAIVPFYGQGMNSGFEDVRIFTELAASMDFDWDKIIPQFSAIRKKDVDAISKLALHNFIEMRDHVGNPAFLKRKKLEAELQAIYPKDWIPLYSMVTFSDIPYSEAWKLGQIQNRVMDEFLTNENNYDKKEIITRYNTLKKTIKNTTYNPFQDLFFQI